MCPNREIGCRGQRPKVEACSKYVREQLPYVGVRKGVHGMVEIKLLFQVAVCGYSSCLHHL